MISTEHNNGSQEEEGICNQIQFYSTFIFQMLKKSKIEIWKAVKDQKRSHKSITTIHMKNYNNKFGKILLDSCSKAIPIYF